MQKLYETIKSLAAEILDVDAPADSNILTVVTKELINERFVELIGQRGSESGMLKSAMESIYCDCEENSA